MCVLQSSIPGGLQLTVDSNVGILIKAGIGFQAGFGFSATFEDKEVMFQESDAPFDRRVGVVMFEGVCLSLRYLDEFPVGYASRGPVCRKMVGVQFMQARPETGWSDDDAFTPLAANFDEVHRTVKGLNAISKVKIPHTFGVRSGIGREFYKRGTRVFQSRNYDIFQMARHAM